MARSLRDCVSGEAERAVMRDAVVGFSSCQCLVKVREVLVRPRGLGMCPRGRWRGWGHGLS
jgi:hypothetical protein